MIYKSILLTLMGAFLCTGSTPVFGQTIVPSASPPSKSVATEIVRLMDLSPKIASKPGNPEKVLSFGGKPQTNAFETVGYNSLSYQLKGKSQRLTGVVGFDDSMVKTYTETAEIVIYGDNKKIWSSGLLKVGSQPVSVDVDLQGVNVLVMEVDAAGNQVEKVRMTWVNMSIAYSGFRPSRTPGDKTPFEGEVFMTPKGPDTPRITGGRIFGVRPGAPFLFTVTASGQKPMTFAAKNLPQGLTLNAETGQMTGCLPKEGEHRVLLSARNALGRSERELKIVVGNQLALSPPMGWNSWNVHLKSVDQQKVERAAELLVSLGLKDHGYVFVNIDDGWQGVRGGKENALQPNEKFPDMKGMCDKIHSLGLKAGIYHTPWMTSFGSLPGGTAATPDGKWSKDKKEFKVGPCSFLKQDARLWGEWGMDFCKWDWYPHKPEEIIAVAEALNQSGRDMVCKLSNRAVMEHAQTYVKYANSWRTTNDLLSHWTLLYSYGFWQDQWAQYGGPGHWLDMDSLLVGHAWGRAPNINPDEQYLMMSMWALMSAPLWLSCELEKLDEFSIRLLTNDEVLDINQDLLGKSARRKWRQGQLEAWIKDLEDGSKAVGFFNRGRATVEATIDLKDLGLTGKYHLRDLWKRADLPDVEGQITINPRPHGVQLYKFIRTK